jgi:tyrosine-protein phosphatase YwqE
VSEFDNLSREELEEKLNELKDLLDEVVEERGIILGQENLHLSHHLVDKYKNEINEITEKISAVEDLLKAKA